jgi:hypothetical protein
LSGAKPIIGLVTVDDGFRFRSTHPTAVETMSHLKMRTGATAFSCCSAVLALGISTSHAAGQSIDSAYTSYDTKACPHRAGGDPEDYGNGTAEVLAWRCW